MATYTSYTTRKPDTNVITIAPNIADIDLADTYQQLVDTQNTSLGNTLTPDIMPASELQAAMDYRNAFKQGDTITAVNNFYKLITSYINQPDFSLDTVLFWYYKLKYSNKEITAYQNQASFYNQNILTNQIFGASLFANNVVTNNNTSDNYFDIVSDSIGCVANSKFIQLDSTLPLFDVSQQYYGTPIPIAASTDSKISANTRNVMYNLSQKTTMYMKRNLLNIGYTNLTLQQNLAADATTSHGLNLINDLPTFVNINKMLDQFKSALGAVFSQAKAFSFVQYLNNIGNTTALNLRDIFPVATSDRDFLVVTSEQAAQASVAEAQQEQTDASAAAALAQQQQSFVINASTNISGNLQPTQTGLSTGTVPQGSTVPGTGNSTVCVTYDSKGREVVNIYGDGALGTPDPNQLGSAVVTSGTIRVDTDGSPPGTFTDQTAQSDTSVHLNGFAVDASTVPYVVLTPQDRAQGVRDGDWAQVYNSDNNQQVWARVVDNGPSQSYREVSAATAQAIGVGVQKNSNTTTDPNLTVSFYPGSRNIPGHTPAGNTAIATASTPVPGIGGA